MSDMRIKQSSLHNKSTSNDTVQEAQKRVHLHQSSQYENARPTFAGIGKPDLSALKSSDDGQQRQGAQDAQQADEAPTLKLRDGTRLELPRMSAADKAQIEQRYAQMPPEQQQRLRKANYHLGAMAYAEVANNPEGVKLGEYSAGLTSAAQGANEGTALTANEANKDRMVADATLFGMEGVEQNLHNFFIEVGKDQETAQQTRTEIKELQEMLADWPDDGSSERFDYHEVTRNEDGSSSTVFHEGRQLTKAEATELLDTLETQHTSLLGMENQKQFQLQKMVNDYQQSMNVVSNIVKNMHETQKGILQNLKA